LRGRTGTAIITLWLRCFEMIRYSAYSTTNLAARRLSPLGDDDSVREAYLELLKLRERVRIAEAELARRRRTIGGRDNKQAGERFQ